MYETNHAVAHTGLLVAAIRAAESRREDALFTDPFATALAGTRGRNLHAEYDAALGPAAAPIIEVRTRFWDEVLTRSHEGGATRFVLLAAGRDARAFRLTWRPDTVVYELDQPEVIANKDAVLAGTPTTCVRVPIGIDLADDWPEALLAAGFSTDIPTVWLVEGLLQYLDEAAVGLLFERIDALSATGSALCYDVVGQTLLAAPFLEPVRRFMSELGAPWIFASDEPADLAARFGWTTTVTDSAEAGNRWQRWPAPAVPLNVPGVARGYFVEATKN
ncbi:SAM-dependent methyltransferase [Nocardia bovistercoris]|uniref:S-adenosyl-L-methionine-dependent methyltransferase n=1 Tax=Nocardia bovistercoris TaxID=2785916 RepID=A0A931IKH8_9NOCA|nr:SAM-dependent methyltransferase [Nocardia bovistercoris]MBH0781697.1 SAM-dependent methyltransferase [Nocardia bovistercoris]